MTSNRNQKAQRWALEMLEHAESYAALDGYSQEDAFEIGAEAKRFAEILRSALTQPAANEPVATVSRFFVSAWNDGSGQGGGWRYELKVLGDLPVGKSNLYAAPPAAAPVAAGEPVAKYRERSNHDVIRRNESQPCFCWADSDHRIGQEVAAPPAAAHGDRRSDADYAIEHGRYLANDADKFMKALNDAFDPETEETDLHDESISEARERLASSVYEFRKRAYRAMRAKAGEGGE